MTMFDYCATSTWSTCDIQVAEAHAYQAWSEKEAAKKPLEYIVEQAYIQSAERVRT